MLPSELHLQVASYLEPGDLKSYSLVSRQFRACALEYMLFATHDKETTLRAVGAGARKLRLTWDGTVVDNVVEPNKVEELILRSRCTIAVEDLSVFKNLTILHIKNCRLTQLLLPSALVTLDCRLNELPTLPTLPSTLVTLNCAYNRLTQLPTLPSTLVTLQCFGNQLTQLPSLPSTLVTLDCSYNYYLTEVPSLPSFLVTLNCSFNALTRLPPILPPTLVTLYCTNNRLTEVPLRK